MTTATVHGVMKTGMRNGNQIHYSFACVSFHSYEHDLLYCAEEDKTNINEKEVEVKTDDGEVAYKILLVTSRTGLKKEWMNVHGWAQKFIRYNEYT